MDGRRKFFDIGFRTRKIITKKRKSSQPKASGGHEFLDYWTESEEETSHSSVSSNHSPAKLKKNVTADSPNKSNEEQETFALEQSNAKFRSTKSKASTPLSKTVFNKTDLLLKEAPKVSLRSPKKSISMATKTKNTLQMEEMLSHYDEVDFRLMKLSNQKENIADTNVESSPQNLEKGISKGTRIADKSASEDEYDLNSDLQKLGIIPSSVLKGSPVLNKKKSAPNSVKNKASEDVSSRSIHSASLANARKHLEDNVEIDENFDLEDENVSRVSSKRTFHKSTSSSPGKVLAVSKQKKKATNKKKISAPVENEDRFDDVENSKLHASPDLSLNTNTHKQRNKNKTTSFAKSLENSNNHIQENDIINDVDEEFEHLSHISPKDSYLRALKLSNVKTVSGSKNKTPANRTNNVTVNDELGKENTSSNLGIKRKLFYVSSDNHDKNKSTSNIKSPKKAKKITQESIAETNEVLDVAVKEKAHLRSVSPRKHSSKVNKSKSHVKSLTNLEQDDEIDINKSGNLENNILPEESESILKQKSGVLPFASPKNTSSIKSKRYSDHSKNPIPEACESDTSERDDTELSHVSPNKHTSIINDKLKSRSSIKTPASSTQNSNLDKSLSVKNNSRLISKRKKSESSNLEEGNFESEKNTTKKKLARLSSNTVDRSSSGSKSNTSINSLKHIKKTHKNSFKEKETKKRKTHESKNKQADPLTEDSHSLKKKKSNTEKVQKKSVVAGNIRRSTRQHYAPFARWRNERLLYFYDKNGGIEIVGVDKGLREDDGATKSILNRLKKTNKTVTKPKKAKLIDVTRNKKLTANVIKQFSHIPWDSPSDQSENCKPPYSIKRMFDTEKSAFGFVQIEINQEKPQQYMPEQDLHLTVIRGELEITIQKNNYKISEKDMIIVPTGCAYSLKNVGKVKALLSYVVGKFQYFESLNG